MKIDAEMMRKIIEKYYNSVTFREITGKVVSVRENRQGEFVIKVEPRSEK